MKPMGYTKHFIKNTSTTHSTQITEHFNWQYIKQFITKLNLLIY
jgi:hypothetical protein